MALRYPELDRLYRRRMSATLPIAAFLLAITLFTAPSPQGIPQHRPTLGVRGPLRLFPELDIEPDELSERRLTAAPVSVMGADFVVLEIETATELPIPEPEPVPVPVVPDERQLEALTLDDIQDAIRTTGLPVPAPSELEVLRVQRPVYPREAIRRSIEGTVEIALLVDLEGRVVLARPVLVDRLPLLEQAAVEAAYGYLFQPYLVDGVPTPFWVRIPFAFRLIS